jgi:hypothetical protein
VKSEVEEAGKGDPFRCKAEPCWFATAQGGLCLLACSADPADISSTISDRYESDRSTEVLFQERMVDRRRGAFLGGELKGGALWIDP